jgi:hypothetical protein
MFTLIKVQRLSVSAFGVAICFLVFVAVAQAQSADELAKKLSNPVASLISVPLQFNQDFGGGIGDDGLRSTLNIQPVIPISISENWNLISRTIVPIIYQEDYINDGGLSQFGLGDVVQSAFFSPKEPTANGLIWGIGPAFLLPTGTNDSLSGEKWAAGPTGVALKQQGKWTYGGLFNHLVDFAGEDNRADINATFIQPFIAYAVGQGLTYTINVESTYDHESEQWTVPVNLMASKVTRMGEQLISVGGGLKFYADGPDNAPDWGFRIILTLLYPK